ncbi:MAG: 16S rRNA (uracil(1498)-N(3))-methyltransferase [Kiritimatiellia bacterium]
MNRILFEREAVEANRGIVRLTGRAAHHILSVLKAKPGSILRLGEIGGARYNEAELVAAEEPVPGKPVVAVRIGVPTAPLARAPYDLLLAMPRPKCLTRLLPQIAAFGVRKLYLTAAEKVEKSYWGSTRVREEERRGLLLDGLEQAGDTILPEVRIIRRLKPFLEDDIPRLYSNERRFFAHPDNPGDAHVGSNGFLSTSGAWQDYRVGANLSGEGLLAIGPEGGWTPFEVAMFDRLGFQRLSLGERIFRTDTAVVSLLALADSR